MLDKPYCLHSTQRELCFLLTSSLNMCYLIITPKKWSGEALFMEKVYLLLIKKKIIKYFLKNSSLCTKEIVFWHNVPHSERQLGAGMQNGASHGQARTTRWGWSQWWVSMFNYGRWRPGLECLCLHPSQCNPGSNHALQWFLSFNMRERKGALLTRGKHLHLLSSSKSYCVCHVISPLHPRHKLLFNDSISMYLSFVIQNDIFI